MVKFIEEYEKLKAMHPELYISINESRRGNYWRIKVYAHEMAIIGDAELLTAELEDREEAFAEATRKLQGIPKRIVNLIEAKKNGRKVGHVLEYGSR